MEATGAGATNKNPKIANSVATADSEVMAERSFAGLNDKVNIEFRMRTDEGTNSKLAYVGVIPILQSNALENGGNRPTSSDFVTRPRLSRIEM